MNSRKKIKEKKIKKIFVKHGQVKTTNKALKYKDQVTFFFFFWVNHRLSTVYITHIRI